MKIHLNIGLRYPKDNPHILQVMSFDVLGLEVLSINIKNTP